MRIDAGFRVWVIFAEAEFKDIYFIFLNSSQMGKEINKF